MTMDNYDIIRVPRITEKGSRLKEKSNVLTFEVRSDANKVQVRKAIEVIFKVKVLDVTTVKDVTPQAHNGCRPRKRRRV